MSRMASPKMNQNDGSWKIKTQVSSMASFWVSIRLNFERKLHVFLKKNIPFTLSESGICLSLARKYLVGWFQPIRKILLVKLDHETPNFRGEK